MLLYSVMVAKWARLPAFKFGAKIGLSRDCACAIAAFLSKGCGLSKPIK